MRVLRHVIELAGVVGLVWALAGGISVVEAHAHLESSQPARDAIVGVAPESVELVFSEEVETPFSTFKVYPLSTDDEPENLRSAADALVDEVLQKRGDESERVDLGLVGTDGRQRRVEIRLQDNLLPGSYVVMWRALSVDTHVTTGHLVFTYAPDS